MPDYRRWEARTCSSNSWIKKIVVAANPPSTPPDTVDRIEYPRTTLVNTAPEMKPIVAVAGFVRTGGRVS
jgi:hypothetical protein